MIAIDARSPQGTGHLNLRKPRRKRAENRGGLHDVTGKDSRGKRPLRAGDYSFNQIGLTGFFMLLSNIPPGRRKELGHNYIVGGCGGNTAWHTEKDLLDVADPDVLFTNINIYVAAITRVLNADILPFEHSRAAREIREQLEKYQASCKGHLNLAVAIEAARQLEESLGKFERTSKDVAPSKRPEFNQAITDIARLLVPVNYARGERFDHDAAVSLPAVPKLDRAPLLADLAKDHMLYRSLQTELIRETNKIVDSLDSARLIAERLS